MVTLLSAEEHHDDCLRLSLTSIYLFSILAIVRCEVEVQAYLGEDVLLPCVYSRISPVPETGSIFWRDKDNNAMLNVIRKETTESFECRNFRGRVKGFPDQYRKGNFSIILKNVSLLDRGAYECHVPAVDFMCRVQLAVSGERPASTSPAPGSSVHGGAVTLHSLHLTLLSVLLSVLVGSELCFFS
ncbi:hypothetical protein Q5P01_005789 [Channa striata]|uniref:Ig-like domain-containing protein n=1 Tax=Channa striata TaxID=64152 RepID=A0AA88NDC1_CHASR|nr:hypothetical protein Q5P01_005789 [Channa striata]